MRELETPIASDASDMTDRTPVTNQVLLTAPLTVRNLKKDPVILSNVGDAVQFLHANFPLDRRTETKWQHTAQALQIAAATNDASEREYATKAVIALLHAEGLLARH